MATLKIANFTTIVTIEVEISKGIGIHLIGIPDLCVRENLLRIVTALQSAGVHIPAKKIIINCSAVDMYGNPKRIRHTGSLDFPIAVGIIKELGLLADGIITEPYMAGGQLMLDGTILNTEFNLREVVK